MFAQGMGKIMGIGSPFHTCVSCQARNTFCMSLEQIEVIQGSTICWGFCLVYNESLGQILMQCQVQVTSYYLLSEINVPWI